MSNFTDFLPISGNGPIAAVVVATSPTTLTSTPTLLQYTPAGFGQPVTLPDATTMAEGTPVHCISNRSSYLVPVKNGSGTLLGYVPAFTDCDISLSDNSTSDGSWGFSALQPVGISALIEASVFTGGLTTVSAGGSASVDMGGGIEIILGTRSSDGHLYAVAHNYNTGVSGTPTAIRAANIDGTTRAAHARHSATQLLVVSCTNGATALEAVIVTLDTGTLVLTPGTPDTETLAANVTAFADGCGLLPVPSNPNDFVLTYTTATPAAEARVISVSGATPSISAATSLDGTTGALAVATADKVIIVSANSGTYYAKPYTVTTTTLTGGTGFSDGAYSAVTINKLFALGSRWVALFNVNGTIGNTIGSLLSLSGTTVTDTTVTALANMNLSDAGVVNGKVLVSGVTAASGTNLLTDSAGTISAGTAINIGANGRFWYSSGSDAYVSAGTSAYNIDCSGASPVLSGSIGAVTAPTASNSVLTINPVLIEVGDNSVDQPVAAGTALGTGIENGIVFASMPKWPFSFVGARGYTNKQRWGYNNVNLLAKLEAI